MSRPIPVNDYFLVEEIKEQWAGTQDAEEGIRRGRVVDISKLWTYWGSHTYYFDSSANNPEHIQQVFDKYKDLVGRVVFWPERSESGAIIEHDGKKYIFMKWASIMGVLEENDGTN